MFILLSLIVKDLRFCPICYLTSLPATVSWSVTETEDSWFKDIESLHSKKHKLMFTSIPLVSQIPQEQCNVSQVDDVHMVNLHHR